MNMTLCLCLQHNVTSKIYCLRLRHLGLPCGSCCCCCWCRACPLTTSQQQSSRPQQMSSWRSGNWHWSASARPTNTLNPTLAISACMVEHNGLSTASWLCHCVCLATGWGCMLSAHSCLPSSCMVEGCWSRGCRRRVCQSLEWPKSLLCPRLPQDRQAACVL